ncbi:MAG: SsrA-binding protein SmpB [Puniceicoccales bacterium]|jgi:SsrA-binding protein|nr:SsrA-binding protein SmpB [Puniceicoccales bacterium]
MAKGAGTAEICNRKASHRYFILERVGAGIILSGTEVKALREGRAHIEEAFVRVGRDGRPWLYGAHIEAYSHGTDANHLPTRPRQLLLHKREIVLLRAAAEKEGQTVVPLRLHLERGLVKVELGFCKGKQLYDKRDSLRRKMAEREMERAIAQRRKQG